CRIETWLLRIAVNLVRDHGKSRRTSFWKRLVGLEDRSTNDEPREFATPQPSPERVLLAREQLQSILNAVSSLPTQQRSVFLLRFAEEMSLAQIADVLDVKVGTVKAQLARARICLVCCSSHDRYCRFDA